MKMKKHCYVYINFISSWGDSISEGKTQEYQLVYFCIYHFHLQLFNAFWDFALLFLQIFFSYFSGLICLCNHIYFDIWGSKCKSDLIGRAEPTSEKAENCSESQWQSRNISLCSTVREQSLFLFSFFFPDQIWWNVSFLGRWNVSQRRGESWLLIKTVTYW